MRIGQLDDGQGLWVSFDKRGDSDHPRYWSEAGKNLSLVALKGHVDFAKGLELSQFSSKRRTNKQKPHQHKQKLLIRQVYHQGGVLYEGDLEMIEALQAVKDKTATQKRRISLAKSGKVKNVAQKKAPKSHSDSVMKFCNNTSSLPDTHEFAKELQGLLGEQMNILPPPTYVLQEAIRQAHADGAENATRSLAFLQWCWANDKQASPSEDGDDEDSGVEDEDGEDDEDDEDDEGEQYENEALYEPEYEDEEMMDEQDEESIGVKEKKDDSDAGAHSDARVDSDAAVGLEGIPESSGTSTQLKRRRWDYLDNDTPGITFERARDILFHHYNIKD